MSKRIPTAKIEAFRMSLYAQGESNRKALIARLVADDPIWWTHKVKWVKARKRSRRNGIAIWVTR